MQQSKPTVAAAGMNIAQPSVDTLQNNIANLQIASTAQSVPVGEIIF